MKPLTAALALLLTTAAAQAQTALRYQFKPGDKVPFTVEIKSETKFKGLGKDQLARIEARADWTLHVLEVAPDGTAKVTYKLDRLVMVMDSDGNTERADTDNLAQIPKEGDRRSLKALLDRGLGATVTATGQIKDVKAPEGLTDPQTEKAKPDDVAQMLVQMLIAPTNLTLPADKLARDQTWKGPPVDMRITGVPHQQVATFTYKGPTQLDGKAVEQVRFKVEALPLADAPKGKLAMRGEGAFYLDNAAGRLVGARQSLEVEYTEESGGVTFVVVQKSSFVITPRAAK